MVRLIECTSRASSTGTIPRTGDVIYVYIFGNPILVLNTAKVANELLDKRSSIYSSRPHRTMVGDL